jgi:hypothetical protein
VQRATGGGSFERPHRRIQRQGPAISIPSPYLSIEEASFISGAVFTVTRDGRVMLYSDPEPTAEIQKDGAPWSVDELIETVPLPCSRAYVSSATRNVGDDVRGPGRPGRSAHRRSWNSTRYRRAAGATTKAPSKCRDF